MRIFSGSTFFRVIFFFYLLSTANGAFSQYTIAEADSILENLHKNSIYEFDSSIEVCNDLVSVYKTNGDSCKLIRTILTRVNCEYSLAQFETALSSIIEAQRIYSSSTCDSQTLALLHLTYGRFYFAINEFEKADSLSQLGIDQYQTDWSDKTTLAKLHLLKGSGTLAFDKVVPHLDTCIQLARNYDIPFLEQRALINIGSLYASRDSLPQALFYFKLALQVAKKRNDASELCVLYNNLAGLSNDADEVLSFIDSAIHFANLTNNHSRVQLFSENKAYFYYSIGEYEIAYNELWWAVNLKDSLFNIQIYEAIAEMEQKYETEKNENEIKTLKLEKLSIELDKVRYKRNQNIALLSGLVFVLLALSLWSRLNFIRKSKTALQKEKDISEGLLLNILPESVADELKLKGYTDAKEFDQATILFTDFKGFTALSEQLSATDLVHEIDICFKAFDNIMEEYGIEKIKTIGDAYMAAGGLHTPRTAEAADVVKAGLDMQEFVANRKYKHDELGIPSFEMRVGVNTGAVIAGVVGVKKFQYDIWGDTVNTASRMESSGAVGKVNISRATYELLKNDSRFTFENRGKIEAKGKGEMEMWFASLKTEGSSWHPYTYNQNK